MFDGALPLSYRGLVGHLPVFFFGFFRSFMPGFELGIFGFRNQASNH